MASDITWEGLIDKMGVGYLSKFGLTNNYHQESMSMKCLPP